MMKHQIVYQLFLAMGGWGISTDLSLRNQLESSHSLRCIERGAIFHLDQPSIEKLLHKAGKGSYLINSPLICDYRNYAALYYLGEENMAGNELAKGQWHHKVNKVFINTQCEPDGNLTFNLRHASTTQKVIQGVKSLGQLQLQRLHPWWRNEILAVQANKLSTGHKFTLELGCLRTVIPGKCPGRDVSEGAKLDATKYQPRFFAKKAEVQKRLVEVQGEYPQSFTFYFKPEPEYRVNGFSMIYIAFLDPVGHLQTLVDCPVFIRAHVAHTNIEHVQSITEGLLDRRMQLIVPRRPPNQLMAQPFYFDHVV